MPPKKKVKDGHINDFFDGFFFFKHQYLAVCLQFHQIMMQGSIDYMNQLRDVCLIFHLTSSVLVLLYVP
jgi:hypothetical protein